MTQSGGTRPVEMKLVMLFLRKFQFYDVRNKVLDVGLKSSINEAMLGIDHFLHENLYRFGCT
jgi:hypothetical protein